MSRGRLGGIDKSLSHKQGAKERASDLLAQKLKASAEKKRDRFSDLDSNPMFKEAALNVGGFRSISYSKDENHNEYSNRSGASVDPISDQDDEFVALPETAVKSFFKTDELCKSAILDHKENKIPEVLNLLNAKEVPTAVIVHDSETLEPIRSQANESRVALKDVFSPQLKTSEDEAAPFDSNATDASSNFKKLARSVLRSGKSSALMKPSWETDFSKDTFEVFKIVHAITGPRHSYLASGYCALYEKAKASGTVTLHLNRNSLAEILGTTSSGTITRFLKNGVALGLFLSQSFTVKSAGAQSGTYVHLCFPWK